MKRRLSERAARAAARWSYYKQIADREGPHHAAAIWALDSWMELATPSEVRRKWRRWMGRLPWFARK